MKPVHEFDETIMSKPLLEKLSTALSLAVIACAVWFWAGQVGNVLEMLSLLED
jgi:hypothetical protein